MLEFDQALSAVLSGTDAVIKNNGFEVVRPEGCEKSLPVFTDGDHSYFDFVGNKGKIRIEIFGNQALLFYTDVNPDEATDEDLVKASANYFNLDEFEASDIKSLCNELNETIDAKFGDKKATSGKSKKMPVPVSKSAAKNGVMSYDANTLANRLAAIYPELKTPYKENYDKYGEFLAEEFFVEHANAVLLNTIRLNVAAEVKRLFKILNDIYENGSSDTQGLIAVTILGEMKNDPKLMETAQKYMCEDMSEPVVLVNKYLASSKGKKAIEKLKSPPAYKPKKEKKNGFFSQMMAASAQQGGMPPM